ncbi:hypothetical protein [Oceanirhabdus sp. W0125-5]|uniref:hypothetical protein n=1 Tax=Oceanirhabdus sp. W0125-5 TaxID=2999116 RepID=UPI0022F2CACE|nr:hypothetical protein [Oceanirhabdus sp. W0125-5]WBW97907.1 hypothetical protein OW730_03755 [Oceanirhabdus sp. W0125-5]
MKKVIIFFLLICNIMIISCTSSSKEKYDDVKETVEKEKLHDFQLKIAENIVNNYFLFLLNENYDKVNELYTTDIKVDDIGKNDSDLKLRGYSIYEMNEVGKTAEFQVKVSYNDTSNSLAMANEFKIKVIKEEGLYRISEVNEIPHREIFLENNTIRLRDENSVKSYLVIDDSGIPKYISHDEKGKKYDKKENNIKNYKSLNINYNGDKICFSKEDENCYLAMLDINEVMLIEKEKEEFSAKELPIGENIVTLDYTKDANVRFSVFSEDNRFIAVQFIDKGLKRVKIFNSSNGEEIPVELEEKLNLKEVDISFKSFHKGMVNLEVLPADMKNLNKSNLFGLWKLELETSKFHKI